MSGNLFAGRSELDEQVAELEKLRDELFEETVAACLKLRESKGEATDYRAGFTDGFNAGEKTRLGERE